MQRLKTKVADLTSSVQLNKRRKSEAHLGFIEDTSDGHAFFTKTQNSLSKRPASILTRSAA